MVQHGTPGVLLMEGEGEGEAGESLRSWPLVGGRLMAPLFDQNLLGLQNIPRQFFLQVYHTFLHIGETRYPSAFLLPSRPPRHPHLHPHPGDTCSFSHGPLGAELFCHPAAS